MNKIKISKKKKKKKKKTECHKTLNITYTVTATCITGDLRNIIFVHHKIHVTVNGALVLMVFFIAYINGNKLKESGFLI